MGIWVNYDENKFNSPYRKWDLFTENIKRGYVEKYMNSKDYSDYSIPSTDIMMGLKDIEEVRLKGFTSIHEIRITEDKLIKEYLTMVDFPQEYKDWGMNENFIKHFGKIESEVVLRYKEVRRLEKDDFDEILLNNDNVTNDILEVVLDIISKMEIYGLDMDFYDLCEFRDYLECREMESSEVV